MFGVSRLWSYFWSFILYFNSKYHFPFFIMKYALYHFEIDNSLYVGESSWILDLDEVDRNNDKFDFESGPVEVSWPYGREKNSVYSAAVLKFSGTFIL